jgi:cysteine desulfurase
MAHPVIYLDYNATTPVDPRVVEEMLPYFTEKFGNPSSRTHREGWIAAEAVDRARAQTAGLLKAEPSEIIFTSGATESVNLAIAGTFRAYASGRNHIITFATEHHAVLDVCKALEREGASITILPVDRMGRPDLDLLAHTITDKTLMVCAMYANNETGNIHPIVQMSGLARARGAFMMCDASQAAGKVPIDVNGDGIDLCAVSAHKMYGPKGVGALYVRRKNPRVRPLALLYGGGHESGMRSGTLNVPGIVGIGKACELNELEMWDTSVRLSRWRTRLEQSLEMCGDVFINGDIKNRLPHVSNLTLTGMPLAELASRLPKICFSAGSACTSSDRSGSHVLHAMGLSMAEIGSSIRISLGKPTQETEIDIASDMLQAAISDYRRSSI